MGIARRVSVPIAVALLVAAVPLAARRSVNAVASLGQQAAAAIPRGLASDPREPHLQNLRMLTDGGENAEAYFSFDGRKIIFQSARDSGSCDQIYTMNADGTGAARVSNGQGRTTCSVLLPGRQVDPLRFHVPRVGGMPAQAGLRAWLRLARLRGLRHLPRQPGWH